MEHARSFRRSRCLNLTWFEECESLKRIAVAGMETELSMQFDSFRPKLALSSLGLHPDFTLAVRPGSQAEEDAAGLGVPYTVVETMA